MNQDDTQWGRARKAIKEACWLSFEALSQNEMMNQNSEKNQRGDNDLYENEVGWIGTKPPYYSGGWSVAGSTLNIIGGGVFSASFSFLHDTNVSHWFWVLCPSGILTMALAWGFMAIHAECERQRSRKEKGDDMRAARIRRYCKRYKARIITYVKGGQLLGEHSLQAMLEAKPQFLKANVELLAAYDILQEFQFPPSLHRSEVEDDLLGFFALAAKERKNLDGANAHWLLGAWKNYRKLQFPEDAE